MMLRVLVVVDSTPASGHAFLLLLFKLLRVVEVHVACDSLVPLTGRSPSKAAGCCLFLVKSR